MMMMILDTCCSCCCMYRRVARIFYKGGGMKMERPKVPNEARSAGVLRGGVCPENFRKIALKVHIFVR